MVRIKGQNFLDCAEEVTQRFRKMVIFYVSYACCPSLIINSVPFHCLVSHFEMVYNLLNHPLPMPLWTPQRTLNPLARALRNALVRRVPESLSNPVIAVLCRPEMTVANTGIELGSLISGEKMRVREIGRGQ